MTKKEFLIAALGKLESDWLPAGGLKIMVEQAELTDTIIDTLYVLVSDAIQHAESDTARGKLESLQSAIKTIKAKEAATKEQEEKELAAMEELLEQI